MFLNSTRELPCTVVSPCSVGELAVCSSSPNRGSDLPKVQTPLKLVTPSGYGDLCPMAWVWFMYLLDYPLLLFCLEHSVYAALNLPGGCVRCNHAQDTGTFL